jgi:hypothetical protein
MNYQQVRKDFEYLETIAQLDDQVELDAERENLMRDPTKAKAAQMYDSGIRLWFGEHRGKFIHVKRVMDIADRYYIAFP